jgi:hypothetical protein
VDLDPDDPLADRMLDEDREISEALAGAVRADTATGRGEVAPACGNMVLAHARHEERYEFHRLREAVPEADLRQMARALRVAEEAAKADAGRGGDPEGAEPRTLPQTVERVRDALRGLAREVLA